MSETQELAVPAAPVVSESIPPPTEAAPPPSAPNTEEAAPEAGTEEGQPEKPRQKASERIGELYGRMKTAERERDQAIAEVQRLRQPAVSREQFDQLSYDEQQRAIVRDAVREERAQEMEQAARARHQEAEFLLAQQYNDRVTSLAKQIPDIVEKLSDPTLPISNHAAQIIAQSEAGPQMAYWLANNRTDALAISRLPPAQQAYELGKLEARINAAPQARKVSKAPAPVPMVGGGGNPGAKDPTAMSISEYSAWRKAGNG